VRKHLLQPDHLERGEGRRGGEEERRRGERGKRRGEEKMRGYEKGEEVWN
jgi:hypothetical protein